MRIRIVIPDLGHGNSIGLFEESSLLIDCGTVDGTKVCNFDNLIRNRLALTSGRALLITLFHFYHHSLLESFSHGFFENIYLPRLPRRSTTANAMLNFMSMTIVSQYQKYHLISNITTKGRIIRSLVKDEQFSSLKRDWDVLWPDYSILDRINRTKISKINSALETAKGMLNEQQASEFDRLYNALSEALSGEEQTEVPALRPEIDRPPNPEVQSLLESFEGMFTDLANRASLVVRDATCSFLFTGDIDDVILNNRLFFGNNEYLLVEAPHHGGYYGNAFDNVSAQFLVISRKASYRARCEYYRDVDWSHLVDTPRNGNVELEV